MSLVRNRARSLAVCGIAVFAGACGDDGGPDPDPDPVPTTQIVFQSTRVTGYPGIFLMDPDGGNVRLVLADAEISHSGPALSPDGSRIAFQSNRDGKPAIYVIGVDGTGLTRITSDTFAWGSPAWSPDGSRIVFVRSATRAFTNAGIFTVNADGTGLALVRSSGDQPAWSPDGSRIAFADHASDGTNQSIYLINPDGTGLDELLTISWLLFR